MTKREPRTDSDTSAVLHVCLSCDYFGVSTDRFCPLCGSRLVHRCEACNHLLSNPFARYCVQCGHPLKVSDEDAPEGE